MRYLVFGPHAQGRQSITCPSESCPERAQECVQSTTAADGSTAVVATVVTTEHCSEDRKIGA